MHRSAAVAGALAVVLLPLASAQCFQDYECMFREPTAGAQYDLRPLCTPGQPYVHTDPVTNATFNFQVSIRAHRCFETQTSNGPSW
jgi:hypothetical protein